MPTIFLDRRMLVIILMYNCNKFRKSDLSIKCLDSLLTNSSTSRLRSSFSTNCTLPLDMQNYRITISHHQIQAENSYISKKQPTKSTKNLKEQLSYLQQKLTNAKKQMNTSNPQIRKKEEKYKETSFLKVKDASSQPSFGKQKVPESLRKSQIEKFISSQPKPTNITTFSVNPYTSIKNNNYYIAEVIRARFEKNSLAVQHINTSIYILEKCKQMKRIVERNYYDSIILPKIANPNLKTLFIDLDETLIHCFENSECQPDFRLNITIEGTPVNVDITIRPYALTFLKKMSKRWEIVVFTASHKQYADAILNEIDPEGILFHHRLYRQHCTLIDETYIKDLSRINRDLSKAVLVDNAAYSYCLQLSNAIPILPYYDGKDFQLSALEGYLSRLEKCEDVRVINQNYFKLDQYTKFENSTDLIEELYHKNQPSIFP